LADLEHVLDLNQSDTNESLGKGTLDNFENLMAKPKRIRLAEKTAAKEHACLTSVYTASCIRKNTPEE
jgi:hypothetical protein